MTLIAGFKCRGGIVLCADTLEEASPVKYSVEKLVLYETDWCRVGFAGSGDQGDLIDTVVERVREQLDVRKPSNFADVKKTIRAALVNVYKNEMATFPQTSAEQTDTRVMLLIAVRAKHDDDASLLLANCSTLHEVGRYDVRGIGEVVRFVASRLYRDDLPLIQGVILAAHLLALSKRNLVGIGGESHIAVLTKDGWLQKEPTPEIELSERSLEAFEKAVADLTLAYADTSLTEEQFFPILQRFVNLTKQFRAKLIDEFTKHHLSWALTDPLYVGDPYRKLPDGAEVMFGPIRADYSFFDHVTVNDPDVRINPDSLRYTRRRKAKYKTDDQDRFGVSVSPSGSPSASVSPSASASPSGSEEILEHDEQE